MTARRLVLILCALTLGWFVVRAVAVHRDYAKAKTGAAVMPPLSADAMAALVESTAAWHGWRVVGKTRLLPRNGGGWQIHVEVKP